MLWENATFSPATEPFPAATIPLSQLTQTELSNISTFEVPNTCNCYSLVIHLNLENLCKLNKLFLLFLFTRHCRNIMNIFRRITKAFVQIHKL